MMRLDDMQRLEGQYYLPVFKRFALAFERGQGAYLYDADGRQYVDFFGGIAVTALGHSHPAVTRAICEQAGRLLHVSNLYYTQPQLELARLLVENSCADRVFFANSGAEANEGAFKLARKYFYNQKSPRHQIITAQHSFHGRTLATVAATGQPQYQAPFAPLTPGFVHVPYNDLQAVKDAIGPQTAGVLLEVVQGEGGVVVPDDSYLQGVQTLCREEGLLLIIDEVQTGLGRTGDLFAYSHAGLDPDIFTLAKALANGVPIGAILCKQSVADALAPGDHGSTFGGNPLACSAGVAVVKTMLEENLPQAARIKGQKLLDGLRTLNKPCIKDVRGRGLMIGAELTPDVPAADIAVRCMQAGYVVGTAGQNTLRLLPPLIIEDAHIDGLLSTLDSAL